MKRKLWRGVALGAVGVLGLAACGDDGGEATGTQSSGSGSAPAATGSGAPGSGSTASTTIAAPGKLTGLDASFGTAGISATPLSTTEHDRFMAVTAAADGKVYAAGFVSKAGDHQMAVARFTAAGALDKSFGTDGVAVVNVAVGGKTAEIARAVVVQSSGKVVIAGPIEHDVAATGDAAKDTDIAVVRLDTSGRPDTGFGTGGIAKIDLGAGKPTSATAFVGDTSWGLGTLAGDKVVVFGTTLAAGADRTDADYVLIGLTGAGAIDTAFGTAGYTKVDLGATGDSPRNVLVQADGKIVATGYSRDGDGIVSPVLIRTSATGQLDTTFGTAGVATAKILESVAESYAVSTQPDGSYILAGYGNDASTEKVDMIVYRFTAAGRHDTAFGTGGVARLDLAKEDDRARNVLALPDGRVLAIGSGKLTAANVDAMVALFDTNGAPQADFGKGGYVLSDLGGPADAWYGVTLAADKRSVYVVGYKGTDTASGGNDDAVLTRLVIG